MLKGQNLSHDESHVYFKSLFNPQSVLFPQECGNTCISSEAILNQHHPDVCNTLKTECLILFFQSFINMEIEFNTQSSISSYILFNMHKYFSGNLENQNETIAWNYCMKLLQGR